MGNFRPLTDLWILARPKLKRRARYHGSFPAGFLHRARALLGVAPHDSVLHVCAGKVRQYPYAGFGKYDKTLDLDPKCKPDYLQDARDPLPPHGYGGAVWDAVLIDRPYTNGDADKYAPGAAKLPDLNALVKNALSIVAPGRRVGVLDYQWPHPGKLGKEVAIVAVGTGRNGRARWFSVFERLEERKVRGARTRPGRRSIR